MGLRVKQLKFIAEDIIRNQKLLEALQNEVRGSAGRLISISEGLDDACYQINDLIDVTKAKGHHVDLSIKTTLLKKLLESGSTEAKKLAVRLLPRNLIINSRFDSNPEVRAEVCRRLPTNLVAEVAEAFPSDFEVKYILEKKESADDGYLHLYDEKRMGDAARPNSQPELSDLWYEGVAKKFLEDYGTNIEYQWEETLVRRYCRSVKSTTPIEIDEQKLYEILMKLIEKKEDEALLADERKNQRKLEKIRESYELQQDELESLLKNNVSNHGYLSKVNEKFSIKESLVPAGIRKYGSGGVSYIPMKGTIPGKELNYLVESVLDEYVSRWNEVQRMKGEPFKLSWNVDGMDVGKVSFSVVLR